MQDFESTLLALIEEKENVLVEIERAIFTKRYNLSKKHFEILSVQTIAMMYAIWEGFVQQSFGLYIDKLNSLNLPFVTLHHNIQVFHIENTFKQFYEYPQKIKQKSNFHDDLRTFYQQPHHIIYRVIDTESNVSFEVLNKFLETLNLELFTPHWNHYTYPHPNLKERMKTFLRYRNSVAHGGDISSEEKVTQEIYNVYRKLVIDLMNAIYDKMIKGLENQTYLKT
jgi:hypothetical protein